MNNMDILDEKTIKQLMEISGGWCVSLYMPTHKTGREQQQDPIRFKNLIARAEEKLLAFGVRKPDVQEVMQPAQDMISKADFWQHQNDGLAVLLSKDHSRIFRLPLKFEELLVVAKNYHVKPLLPLMTGNGNFYVLAISLNRIKLFLGNRDEMSEVNLPEDMPVSMRDAPYLQDPEKHLGFHTGTGSTGKSGGRAAVFHGQGSHADEEEKKDILRYFQYVDDGLMNLIRDDSFPMILAGVDYLLPIYRKANSYPHLFETGLEGSPDDADVLEIHRRAWEIVKPVIEADHEKAKSHFEQLHGKQSDLAVSEIEGALKAASHGRVDTLFVPVGVQQWGRYEPENNYVLFDVESGPESEDLLNLAAAQTILNGGKVYAVHPEDIPGDGKVAAILRYSN